MINNTLAKKRIIAAVAVTVVLIVAIVAVPVIRREICYGTVVGECDNQELVERWQQYGEAYAIGANKDGMPIFKDRKAAMKQAKKDYGLGFEYLREYRNFPKISDNPKVCQQYKMLGWQTVPPILANTVIVPFVLKYAYGTEGMLWYFMLTVGLGEVIVCGVLGSLLRVALKKYRNTLFHE